MKLLLSIAVVLALGLTSTTEAHPLDQVYSILGLSEPRILPNSAFYFIKEWGRGFRMFFSFDPVRRAELELKFADEKLAELEKLAAQKPDAQEALDRAFQNYIVSSNRLETRLNELTGKNLNVERLLDKLSDRVLDHRRLFDDLEDKIAEEKLDEARREMAENTKAALEIDREKFKAKLKIRIERKIETKTSDDSEILDAIEDLNELDQELDEELNQLKKDLEEKNDLTEKEEKLRTCGPMPLRPLMPGCSGPVCKNGKWEFVCAERNEPVPEPMACTQNYDPVCGQDEKTYSNQCFAQIASVEVRHKGQCAESR